MESADKYVFEFLQLMDSIFNNQFLNASHIFDSLITTSSEEIDSYKKEILRNTTLTSNNVILFLNNSEFSQLIKMCVVFVTERIFDKIVQSVRNEHEIVENCKVILSLIKNLRKNNIISMEQYKIDFLKRLLDNIEENFNLKTQVNYGLICKIFLILKDDKTVQHFLLKEIEKKFEKINSELEKTPHDYYWVELILIYSEILLIILETQYNNEYLVHIFQVTVNKNELLDTSDLKLLLNKLNQNIPEHVKPHIQNCLKYCV